MENPFSLQNKTVLVTGAASEVGRQIAIQCSLMGANVIVVDRDSEGLAKTYNLIESEEKQQIICDVSDYTQIETLVSLLPAIDGYSNNGSFHKTLLMKFVQRDILEEASRLNMLAPVSIVQQLVKQKKLNKGASIVFTTSVSGRLTVHYGDTLEAVTQTAITGFTKSAALDLSTQKIRVNSIAPSVIMTEELRNSLILSEEELKEKEKYFPLKRYGTPADVAHAVVFFLSDASSWITGEIMQIDGGYTLL